MIILYTEENNTECDDVKSVFEERRLSYEDRDISNEEFSQELKELGSEKVPFLFDPQSNYKTGDIEDMIDYASEYAF
jgi:glutaredoxin